jgi:hypothetical protein
VEITTGSLVIAFRDEGEAAAFADQLGEAIRRGWAVHRLQPPRLLAAARQGLRTALGAAGGRASAQAAGGGGPAGAAPGGPAARSYQPDTLTTEIAARLAEVHPRTVRKWIAEGAVQSVRGPRGAHQVDAGSLAVMISRRRKEHDEQ